MRNWLLISILLAASTSRAAVHVKGVSLTPSRDGWRLSVSATDTAPYTLRTYPEPARLIVDIPNATLDLDAQLKSAEATTGPVLRYSQFTRKPDAVRVVVNLPSGAGPWYEVSGSPARTIVIDIPKAPHALAKSVHEHPAKRLAFGPPAPPRARFGPPEPDGPPAPRNLRSHLASRGGPVDDSDLMVDPALEPTPAWEPDEAVSLVKAGGNPGPLRDRLIEVVTDPEIRTSRYVWGAETPGQFDCSGLAVFVYDALGVKLPRCSWQQCDVGESVDRGNLTAGDLVFFNTNGRSVSHVGIYLGEGKFLHAANPKANLKITSLDTPYYSARFVNARRVYGNTESSNIGG